MNTATPKQVAFIKRLVDERFNTLNSAGTFATVHEMLAKMDLDNITKGDAKVLIDRLIKMPADPDPTAPTVEGAEFMAKGNKFASPCSVCGHLVDQGAGYYFKRNGAWGSIHAVGDCKENEPQPEGIDLSHVPAGLFAVPDGDTRLKVRIDKPQAGRWEGWTFVKDGAVYGRSAMMGKVAPGGTYVGKAMDAVAAIAADPREAAAAYGKLTGTCGSCGRPLEDPDSVARGIGPVCMQKF